MLTHWRAKAHALAAELAQASQLPDYRWRRAFEETPRHIFVPEFWNEDNVLISGDNPQQRDEWFDSVYADASLATQLAQVPGTTLMWATSSSTRPSLMADMLHRLQVQDGHSVLEVGTGTGYNAALLAHRLGARAITSVDIDAELVDLAAARLAELGFAPRLKTGNGENGVPRGAPYDRIIATCAVPTVPTAWIEQLAVDGLIVADLRGELVSCIAVLHKADHGVVSGRFSATAGHFMWLRAKADNPLRDGGTLGGVIDHDDAEQSTGSPVPMSLLMDNPDVRFLAQLAEPALQVPWRSEQDGDEVLHLHAADGSWALARAQHERALITEGGPRQIWSTVEHAATLWEQLGRPSRGRFGLTAEVSGNVRYWLDRPDHPIDLRL